MYSQKDSKNPSLHSPRPVDHIVIVNFQVEVKGLALPGQLIGIDMEAHKSN